MNVAKASPQQDAEKHDKNRHRRMVPKSAIPELMAHTNPHAKTSIVGAVKFIPLVNA